MSRWNIETIFFHGVEGRRDITLTPGEVNIITGASGTGKSALIKAVDYCLGAKSCELPVYVRRRVHAVGVKWVRGADEIVVGRIVPPVGQKTSTRMFVDFGKNLRIPATHNDFRGAMTVVPARQFLERAFGISFPTGDLDEGTDNVITIRQITPYIFVTKEVIYSETVLLHGLERRDKADAITNSLPYFMGVSTEETAVAERRLRQLRKALEIEVARQDGRSRTDSETKERAVSLLEEGQRLGITFETDGNVGDEALIGQVSQLLTSMPLAVSDGPDGTELAQLHDRRRGVTAEITKKKRELAAIREMEREALGFGGAVARQFQKLRVAEHLNLSAHTDECPICLSKTSSGKAFSEAISNSIQRVREESRSVEIVQPRLSVHAETVKANVDVLSQNLRLLDDSIHIQLDTMDASKRLTELSHLQARFIGRVSYFLELVESRPRSAPKDLSALTDEIERLESQVNREARDIKMRRAEAQISGFATQIFRILPTVAPCVDAVLEFSAKKPSVTVIERDGAGAVLNMPDIGSDQNYLAIHIALSFALQRHFASVNSPVPGVLILDQVSRPYFPVREDGDVTEVSGDDEDTRALRKHMDFLFTEVADRTGLQVVLIEHAYFSDDDRFVKATRQRWTRASQDALIPFDWEERGDGS